MATIPAQYLGIWSGSISDTNRKRPYPGTIRLNENGGTSEYELPTQVAKGTLILRQVTANSVVLREIFPEGKAAEAMLTVELDADGNLKCSWGSPGGQGKKVTSKATMSRG